MNKNVYFITPEEATAILDSAEKKRSNFQGECDEERRGLYLVKKENGSIMAIDNHDGFGWIDCFQTTYAANLWLTGSASQVEASHFVDALLSEEVRAAALLNRLFVLCEETYGESIIDVLYQAGVRTEEIAALLALR